MSESEIPKKSFLYLGIVLSLLIFFSNINTLNVPLNFDDQAVIQQIENYPGYYYKIYPFYQRHLFHLSVSINHSQSGTAPLGYHLVNISLHLLTSFTLFLIVFFTLNNGTSWRGKHAFSMAGLTAILFSINPLTTETVTYISGRTSGMAGFFYLLAILFFILGSLKKYSDKVLQIPLYALALIMFLAAVLSKETCLTLPAVIILYDLCFIKNSLWVPFKNRLIYFYLAFFLPILAILAFQPSMLWEMESWWEKVDFNYPILQAQVIGYAVKLCFFPINLIFDYDFPSNWFASGSFKWFYVLLWLTFIAIVLKNIKKIPPILPFSIFWFIITISVTNSFLPRADLLSERNLYLPSIGPTILISCAYYHFFFKQRSAYFRQGFALILLIVIFQGALTIKRNSTYGTNVRLWEDTLKKSPSDLKVLHNLSHFYLENKENDKALISLIKLSRSNASSFYKSFAHSNLGSIHAQNNNFDFAEKEFKKAIQLDSTVPLGYLNLGTYYASRGWYQKAKTTLEMARDRFKKYRWGYPMPASLNLILARVNFELGLFSEAEKDLKQFLGEIPEEPKGLLLLGKIYQQLGKTNLAIESYRKIKGPAELVAKASNNLGLIYLSLNQPENALVEFKQSLTQNPNLPDTHYNLGKLIIESNGDINSARFHLSKALSLAQSQALKVQINNLLQQISS